MASHVERATARLFGPGSLSIKHINVFPGSRPNVSAEEVAEQINLALDAIEAGDFELVEGD